MTKELTCEKAVIFCLFLLVWSLCLSRLCTAMGNYDKIMRENLGKISKGLLRHLVPINVRYILPVPPRVRKTILEKETDNLFLIKPVRGKKFILHLEFQSTNDKKMPLRVALYNYAVSYIYGIDVISVVIYVGEQKLSMKKTLTSNGSHFEFKLIDIRELDPKLFLESGNSKEVILSILAGDHKESKGLIIDQIFNKFS